MPDVSDEGANAFGNSESKPKGIMAKLRVSKDEATTLSSDLRQSDPRHMHRRRAAVGLSMIASASLGVVAAYQLGMIRHLPEPKLPHLDADKVDASAEAYEWLSTPDAVLGIASYGSTMVLAAMGPPARAKTQPHLPLALAAKVALDVINSARLTIDQWTKHRAFCTWCLIAAGATFATAPLVVPEAVEAFRNTKITRLGRKLRKAA